MKYIKTLSLPVVLIIAFVSYVVYGQKAPVVVSTTSSDQNTETPIDKPVATTTPTNKNKYKDGTFTGDIVDAYYGKAQVAAVISGGKIIDVQFLAYPNDRTTSLNISNKAMPIFKSEVISKQSAQVNVISGATQIAQGFSASLGTALTKALN